MEELMDQASFLEKYRISETDFFKTGLFWDDLKVIYNDHVSNTPFLETYLKTLFDRFIKISHVHSVRYRVKNPEHLIEKIIRKKIKDVARNITPQTYLNEIDDIIGLRILHLFKDEWDAAHEYITTNFSLKEEPVVNYRKGDSNDYLDEYTKKGCKLKEHLYGYRSIHYIIQERILSTTISCEIQVRTVFEEAWSEIDHTIRYPYDIDNSVFSQYLMIFNRLAGSADEMGSFLVFLKEYLAKIAYEAKDEQAQKDTLINQLREEISQLKVSAKKQKVINEKINELDKNINKKTVNSNNLWNEFSTNSFSSKDLSSMVAAGSIFPKDTINSITGVNSFSSKDELIDPNDK